MVTKKRVLYILACLLSGLAVSCNGEGPDPRITFKADKNMPFENSLRGFKLDNLRIYFCGNPEDPISGEYFRFYREEGQWWCLNYAHKPGLYWESVKYTGNRWRVFFDIAVAESCPEFGKMYRFTGDNSWTDTTNPGEWPDAYDPSEMPIASSRFLRVYRTEEIAESYECIDGWVMFDGWIDEKYDRVRIKGISFELTLREENTGAIRTVTDGRIRKAFSYKLTP